MAKRVTRRKAGLKRRMNRRRRFISRPTRGAGVPERASCSVRAGVTPVSSGTSYLYNDIKLSDFTRAVQIAGAYQRYRIKQVKITVKPNMDSIVSTAVGNPQKAYIYYMIDKVGAIPNAFTLEYLRQMGARPFALDEKPFTMTWRPSVLGVDLNTAGSGTFGQYKISPWLSTNDFSSSPGWTPSTVSHLGLAYFIEQVGLLTTFNVDIEVQFEFCKPLLTLPSNTNTPVAQGLQIQPTATQ